MKKTLKKHEQEYIHIPKPSLKKVKNFFLGLILSVLTFFSFKPLIYKWKDLGLDILFKCKEQCSQFANLYQLDIITNLFITAGLIFLSISYLFSIPRKTFYNSAIYVLGVGLIVGTSAGLFAGTAGGAADGAVAATIIGLIFGTITGLFAGLLNGLVAGLEAKADNEQKGKEI